MDKVIIDSGNRSSFEQNKREMFDGMRAYHSSEHQHKRDAVNFLRSILGVATGLYGVIIGSFFTPELSISYATQLSWGIFLLVSLVVYISANSTSKKIEAEHEIYKMYGAEYTRFCYMLELHKSVFIDNQKINGKLIDIKNPIGQGDGYKKTINIITEQTIGVVLLALSLAITVTLIKS